MALIALDSNIIDLIEMACPTGDHADSIEALELPPPFIDVPCHLLPQVAACYWILAMGPYWTSLTFTFSPVLLDELGRAPTGALLHRTALDLVSGNLQTVDLAPGEGNTSDLPYFVEATGARGLDITHVTDAISRDCSVFLTNDRRLRNCGDEFERKWQLRILRPNEFVCDSVRYMHAPWPSCVPWPWECIALASSTT